MCSVLANSDTYLVPWGKTMLGNARVHGLFGYQTTISGTNAITNSFLNLSTVNNSAITYSWEVAAESNGKYNWAFLVHEADLMDHFWGRGTVYADTTGVPTIYYYYDGARRLINVSALDSPGIASRTTMAARALPEDSVQARPLLAPISLRTRTDWDPSEFGLSGPDVITGRSPCGRAFLDRSTGQYLVLWNSGAVDYLSGIESYEPTNMSETDALATAVAFVDAHGGMPSDATFTQVIERRRRPIDVVGAASHPSEILSYAFEFTHDLDGRAFEGFAGDRIFVSVGRSGVDHYFRLWREPQGETPERRMIVGPDQAAQAVQDYLAGDVGRIANVRLGYFSEPYTVYQEVALPVWAVHLIDGRDFAVDALAGCVVPEFDAWGEAFSFGIPTTPPIPQSDPDDLR